MRKLLCVILVLSLTSSPVLAMTYSQENSCHAIIHSAATAAAGSAIVMSQAPGADNIALAVAIGGMTIALANVFDISFSKATAETIGVAVLGTFSTTIAARFVSQWLFGWIPFIGNSINAATMFGMVEWVGWEVAGAFDKMRSATRSVYGKILVTVKELTDILSGEK